MVANVVGGARLSSSALAGEREGEGPHLRLIPASRPESVADADSRSAAGGDATPAKIRLGSLQSPVLKLRSPILLRVGREDGFVTVWSDDLEELGHGPHLTAALEDFQKTVAELYETLRDERDRLGPAMADRWERLQALVEERIRR